MKEDVVAANLANLRQSINELKECIEKQNTTVPKPEQSVKVDFDEKTIYNGVARSFCVCWNEALSVVKQHVWKQQLRYVVVFVVIIVTWAVVASVSSMKHREEAFAYYSMYRAVKEQHQCLMEKTGIELKRNTE